MLVSPQTSIPKFHQTKNSIKFQYRFWTCTYKEKLQEGGWGNAELNKQAPIPSKTTTKNKNWEKNKSQQQVKSIWSFKKREGGEKEKQNRAPLV